MTRITALITCHNRRELTLECLRRLEAQDLPPDVRCDIILVDDGSTDGTGEAVGAAHPRVRLLRGDGSLYWCGGMRMAWAEAEKNPPDHLMTLNDDTFLYPDALAQLLDLAGGAESPVIAVGAVADPDSGDLVYGGRLRAMPGRPPPLGSEPAECDTFNGNCVLIPRAVRRALGPFHHRYTHGFADYDYGIQARRHGIRVLQSVRPVGVCRPNASAGSWRDPALGRWERLKRLRSPKGMPFRDHLAFARRTQGARWWRHLLGPYLRILMGR